VLLLGACALFGLMWTVAGKGSTGIDRDAFAVLATTRGSLLAHFVKVLSVIAPPLVAAVALAVAALLAHRRQWLPGAVIVGGSLMTFLAAHLLKDAQQRPRPHGELVHAGGFSFPSTDAALSVVLIAIAIAVEGAIGNAAPRGRLVAIGVVLTGVTGVLLVAVRVHYLTDVLGGWGLGAAVFAASGLLAYALAAVLQCATPE